MSRARIRAIKDEISIADFLEHEGVELRPCGARQVCVCPLPTHSEKTPSFVVYEDNHFHCYGCDAHGDLLDLVRALHGCDLRGAGDVLLQAFPDKMAAVRERVGGDVDETEDDPGEDDAQPDRDAGSAGDRRSATSHDTSRSEQTDRTPPSELLERNEALLTGFREAMAGAFNVQRYLKSRGFTQSIIDEAEFGWDRAMRALVIPIRDEINRLVGFQFRPLSEEELRPRRRGEGCA